MHEYFEAVITDKVLVFREADNLQHSAMVSGMHQCMVRNKALLVKNDDLDISIFAAALESGTVLFFKATCVVAKVVGDHLVDIGRYDGRPGGGYLTCFDQKCVMQSRTLAEVFAYVNGEYRHVSSEEAIDIMLEEWVDLPIELSAIHRSMLGIGQLDRFECWFGDAIFDVTMIHGIVLSVDRLISMHEIDSDTDKPSISIMTDDVENDINNVKILMGGGQFYFYEFLEGSDGVAQAKVDGDFLLVARSDENAGRKQLIARRGKDVVCLHKHGNGLWRILGKDGKTVAGWPDYEFPAKPTMADVFDD
jgi:hypothetical protein